MDILDTYFRNLYYIFFIWIACSMQKMMYLGMYSNCWQKMISKYWQLTNNTYETGEWYKDFNDIKMTALKKKKKAIKCGDQCTYSKGSSSEDT